LVTQPRREKWRGIIEIYPALRQEPADDFGQPETLCDTLPIAFVAPQAPAAPANRALDI
jgi:hypothetical protein